MRFITIPYLLGHDLFPVICAVTCVMIKIGRNEDVDSKWVGVSPRLQESMVRSTSEVT